MDNLKQEIDNTLNESGNNTLSILYALQKSLAVLFSASNSREVSVLKFNTLTTAEDILLPVLKGYEDSIEDWYDDYIRDAKKRYKDDFKKSDIHSKDRLYQLVIDESRTGFQYVINSENNYHRTRFRAINELIVKYERYTTQNE